MKLTYMNKIARLAVLEALIAGGDQLVDRLTSLMDYWNDASGAIAPQVAANVRRERERQIERVAKFRDEERELLSQVPSGWRCGHRSSVSAWDCKLHAGHRGDHYYGEGKQG